MHVKDSELRKKFGRRLRYLRRDRDLTQEQLAELVDLSINSISELERGITSPYFETLVKLAKAFDVDVGELFKFDER
ncbi:MAG: helix-turn-helix domain-containing protein [Ktedonobacteraceae bacterium]